MFKQAIWSTCRYRLELLGSPAEEEEDAEGEGIVDEILVEDMGE